MKKRITLCTFLLFTLCMAGEHCIGQNPLTLDVSDAYIDPAVKSADRTVLESTLQEAINKYAIYCTLFDPKQKSVNATSVNNFVSLFDPAEAWLSKDYTKEKTPELVDINDYFIEVLEGPLANSGLDVSCSDASLISFIMDSVNADVIWSTVGLTKTFRNFLQDGQSGDYLEPQMHRVYLKFKTYTYFLDEALIREISFAPEMNVVVAMETPKSPKVPKRENPSDLCHLIDGSTLILHPIGEDTISMLEQIVCNALQSYEEKATLRDPQTGGITSSSASAFQQLFVSGSSIHVADFLEYPENIELTEYREDAFKFFRESGLQFDIQNPRIVSINYDPEGFYFIKLKLIKNTDIFLEAETFAEKTRSKGNNLELEMSYIIVKRNMTTPLIESVVAAEIRKPEEKSNHLSFLGGVALGMISATPFSASALGDLISTSASPSLGLQIFYWTNSLSKYRSEHKPFFVGAGLEFQFLSLKAELNSYTDLKNYNTIDGLDGVEIRTVDKLIDRIPVKIIGVPVGISYRLLQSSNAKAALYIDACAMPSYWLQNTPKYDASGFYNLEYPELGYKIFNDSREFEANENMRSEVEMRYNIGAYTLDDLTGEKINGKFLLGYKVGLRLQFPFSKQVFGQVGAQFNGYTSPYLESSTPGPDFVFASKPNSEMVITRKTLFQEYYSKVNANTIFLNAGIRISI